MNKCDNCEKFVNQRLMLCCSCGKFCSIECMQEFHKKQEIKHEKS